MLKKKKEEQEKADNELAKRKAELDRVLAETKLKAADSEKAINDIKKDSNMPVNTKVTETPKKQETPPAP